MFLIVPYHSVRSCDLSISHLSSTDLGSWRCRVQHTASAQYQEAVLEVRENVKDINVRLPDNVKPSRSEKIFHKIERIIKFHVRYELFLVPYIIPDNFTIKGEVHIDVDITSATSNLTVHVSDMDIHEGKVSVSLTDGSSVQVTGHGYDQERQFYIISLGQELGPSAKWSGVQDLVPRGRRRPDSVGLSDWTSGTRLLRGVLQRLFSSPQAGHDRNP